MLSSFNKLRCSVVQWENSASCGVADSELLADSATVVEFVGRSALQPLERATLATLRTCKFVRLSYQRQQPVVISGVAQPLN